MVATGHLDQLPAIEHQNSPWSCMATLGCRCPKVTPAFRKKEDLKATGPNSGVKYFKEGKNIAGDRCASWMDGHFLQGTFNGRLLPNDERPDVSCGGVSGVSALRSFENYVLTGQFDGTVRISGFGMSHETWKAAMTPNAGDILGPDW